MEVVSGKIICFLEESTKARKREFGEYHEAFTTPLSFLLFVKFILKFQFNNAIIFRRFFMFTRQKREKEI